MYDKAGENNTLGYTKSSYKQGITEETINDLNKTFFDFETTTSGEKHMPYLCCFWNDDIQQECVGINTCAADMLNALPTDKNEITSFAHNSNHDCRFILEYLNM